MSCRPPCIIPQSLGLPCDLQGYCPGDGLLLDGVLGVATFDLLSDKSTMVYLRSGSAGKGAPVQVIARLSSLVTVNATSVTAHERKDSELQYLRSVLGGYRSLR